jgi:hypothetical protein
MPRICSLCRQSAEASTKDQKFSACRKCVREKLLPLCLDSLGKADLTSAVAALSADPTAAEKKLQKLVAGQAGQTGQRKPLEFSRGTGRPATSTATPRRRPTVAEQRLAVARLIAREEGSVLQPDIVRSVQKAGLATYGEPATELSATGTVAAPPRPAFRVSGARPKLASQSAGTSALAPGETAARKPTRTEQQNIESLIRRAGLRA